MKIPKPLQPLIDDGIVEVVLRQLKSGKEASVFLVRSQGQLRCAKVYKDAQQRGFHKLAEYQEGRKARGSRDARAMGKGSRHGREQQEAAWKNAEVDALFRLHAAGVRVPKPQGYYEGVLVMDVVTDAEGRPAPRLNDVHPSAELARDWHALLIEQVVRMLCVGLIHGDLSEFNVLLAAEGPVIIDLPQAIDAAGNNNALRMLVRDVENIRAYCGRYAPDLLDTEYAHEIWQQFQSRELRPDSRLTGRYTHPPGTPDVDGVLAQIAEARKEAERRQAGREAAAAEDADPGW